MRMLMLPPVRFGSRTKYTLAPVDRSIVGEGKEATEGRLIFEALFVVEFSGTECTVYAFKSTEGGRADAIQLVTESPIPTRRIPATDTLAIPIPMRAQVGRPFDFRVTWGAFQ